MTDWVKKALTKTRHQRSKLVIIEPDRRLVYGVKLLLIMTTSLTLLEIAHMVFLGRWSSEVFSVITGLAGTVTGVFITQKA